MVCKPWSTEKAADMRICHCTIMRIASLATVWAAAASLPHGCDEESELMRNLAHIRTVCAQAGEQFADAFTPFPSTCRLPGRRGPCLRPLHPLAGVVRFFPWSAQAPGRGRGNLCFGANPDRRSPREGQE